RSYRARRHRRGPRLARRQTRCHPPPHPGARRRADRQGRRIALPPHPVRGRRSRVMRPGTAAVILAAGASTRLGQPKQLIVLGGETLLDRAVRVAAEAGCWPVVVVLGADARRVLARCPLRSAAVLVNPWWQEGMASSLRLGVA